GGRRAIGAVLVGLGGRAPRAEAAPHHVTGEAHLVEPARVVAVEARWQHLALPRAGRGLEALELLDDPAEALGTDQLRVAGDALPAEQEAHQRGRAHRLDLLAEP